MRKLACKTLMEILPQVQLLSNTISYIPTFHVPYCYAAKRRRESKTVKEYKQQDNTEFAQYISKKQISKYSYVVHK